MNKHRETEKKPLNKRLIREVSDNNREYCRALEMTSLNINLWLKRAGILPDSPEEIASKYRRCLAWILSNHIVQRFHKKYGVDVIPFTIGEMYGYGMAVQSHRIEEKESRDISWIACGSVRIDPRYESGNESYHVPENLIQKGQPLWVMEEAAQKAIGDNLNECNDRNCYHRKNVSTYLTIYQIITQLLCAGFLRDAILGAFVDCDFYGAFNQPSHPLLQTGQVKETCLTQDYFELGPDFRDREVGWINRYTGELTLNPPEGSSNIIVMPYKKWCGNRTEKGFDYLANIIISGKKKNAYVSQMCLK
ncbi:MAG: hypothetical protein ACM3UL_01640 [Ignavibacteria bacterium]